MSFFFHFICRYIDTKVQKMLKRNATVEVFCPSCRTGYRIPNEKVPKKPRILMCRNCNHAWRQTFDTEQGNKTKQTLNTYSSKNTVKRPSYSKTVLKILREEAALEAKQRD